MSFESDSRTQDHKDDDKATANYRRSTQPEAIYPSGLRLAMIITSMLIGMFLVSLDRMIISTAIPQITNEFNSAGDIGWYGTAYSLTNCAFQLMFGKLYRSFDIKAVFMSSIILFEAGSALCGAAPSSITFIIGRAIAGMGAGGISSGAMVIIVYAVPLHRRPKYQGLFGAVFGVASVSGMIALIPGVVCLCLALQWAGTKYNWNNGRIIALLVLAFVLLIAFLCIQIWKPEQAILPPKILLQRSIASGFWVSCCQGAHTMIIIYYFPIWFQAIEGVSAVSSGIHLLPTIIPLVVASIITGQLISCIGYYTPFLIFGVCLTSIGAGLITTLDVNTPEAKWIGYQILYGYGLGSSTQINNIAVQTVLPRKDVAIGASLMFFGQQLFGAIFTSVGENVLSNQLARRLSRIPDVEITPRVIQSTGATDVLSLIPERYRDDGLQAYNDSLRVCFQVGLIMACLASIGAVCMEWRSVKQNNPDVERKGEKGSEEEVSTNMEDGNGIEKKNGDGKI
ncbi:hypothetical protein AtubIFM56815_003855 [Aspergillus tubingensis]|uniref:Major facilitator superfamily (MFS) profile domain-containing protein n=1 Tax=Aspergillus tubingensis TaxID=5068 RepID=A0A9W6AY94_ASPTU|nr:hypothetical protein AtubIFM56815_003855 [Aspergillus tubingensis]GLA96679.1 hypothetical protein AtubIFM57143_004157 [Aspergillus tubingensis]